MPPDYSKHADWFSEHIYPHEIMLRGWLRRRFSSVCDVDDVIQEAYLRILRAREGRELEQPKAYLFRTAYHLAIDSSRAVGGQLEKPLAESEVDFVVDDEASPSEALARGQEIDFLMEAIETLPPRCREIFVMRKFDNLSQSEIAAKLGLSVNTVTAQITIGIKKCTAYVERRMAEAGG